MKRHLLLPLAVIGLLALAGPASASAAPVTKLARCHSSLEVTKRYFVVYAKMARIRGTVKMGIRFDLTELRAHQPALTFGPIAGYGVWYRSQKGVSPYRYIRTVNSPDAPAAYHLRVGYRWYGKHGKVLRTVFSKVLSCYQRDLRPELRVRRIVVTHGRRGHDKYGVLVRNSGLTAAGPFSVLLAFPGGAQHVWDVPRLAPGAQIREQLNGAPACSAGAPTATVDSGGTVDERSELNNTLLATCPAP